MPFVSERQRRYMFARHPGIAKRMADDAKRKGEPVVDPQTASMVRSLKNHEKRSKR
jgi:hypothetical protein